MRNQRVPFISREKELALIEQLIDEQGKSHILCINAPGGIGKTRLLEKVQKHLLEERADIFYVLKIADFDNPAFQTLESVLKRIIAEQLDRKYFYDYLNCLHDLEKMREAEAEFTHEGILKKEKEAKESFIQSFNAASAQRRVIWFFDTTDAIREESRKWWQKKLADIGLTRLKNHVLLIAGRDARTIGAEILQPLLPQSVQIIDLLPLEEKASASYLKKKQEQLHIALEEGLEQRLLLLAAGRPIIIDLAVEWRTRGISLSWLTEEPFESLQRLSEEWQKQESKTRREEFEKQLVIHLAQTRNEMDWLILLMAHIYPLDREMTAALLEISQDEASRVFNAAKDYVFVKSLPDGQLKLHDEMERMVNEYVWPEIDPDVDHRLKHYSLATEYLQKSIEKNESEVQKIKKQLELAILAIARHQNEPQIGSATLKVASLKNDILNLKKRRLGYILLIDLKKGAEAFAELFDAAGNAYRLEFRNSVMEQILKYSSKYNEIPSNYIVAIRYIIHLFDRGEYQEARQVANKVLAQKETSDEQQVEIRTKLANIEIRTGNPQEGIAQFIKAIGIAEEHNFKKLQFSALNGLGYNYRLIGDIGEARKTYRKAYRLSLESGSAFIEKDKLASLLNNMAYVYALKRDRDSSLNLCREAEKLWREDGKKRGIGFVNSTLGVICIEFNEHKAALEHFDYALSVLSDGDIDRSMVYLGQATAFWLLGETNEAEEQLRKVKVEQLDMEVEHNKPEYFYIKGNILLKKGLTDEAREAFDEGYASSEKAHNIHYKLNCLAEQARITVLRCATNFQRIPDQLNKLAENIKKIISNENEKQHALPIALLRRCTGDLALLDKQFDQAIEFYQRAFPVIAAKRRYEPYAITGQLLDIQKNVLPYIDIEIVKKLGQHLKTFWINKEHDTRYPEALTAFGYWQSGDINTWGE